MEYQKNLVESNFKIIHQISYKKKDLQKHHHNLFEIVWIKSGKAKFYINDHKYTAKPNSIVLINNFETHSTNIEELPYERYYMLIPKEFLSGLIHDPALLSILKNRPSSFCHVITLKENFEIIDLLVKNIYNEYNGNLEYSNDVIKSYLNIMIVNLFRLNRDIFRAQSQNPQLSIVTNVQQYIEHNYIDAITLKNTADYFHIDMYYLSHIFKEVTGFGFKEYLIKHRINHAKDLLLNTEKSILEICSDSGFNNVNNFIRTFKNFEGIPPLNFRKSIITGAGSKT